MKMATKATPNQIATHQDSRARIVSGKPTGNDIRLLAWRKKFNGCAHTQRHEAAPIRRK